MTQVTTNINDIYVTVNGVIASASQTQETINSMGETIHEISNAVETQMTPEQVQIAISTAIDANTPNEVTTITGYTFNQDGLTISKEGNELTTTITEDGLTIDRQDTTLLTVNHEGVNAKNLHATTYLIIGTTSRFEDYNGGTRTGCFWLGEVT